VFSHFPYALIRGSEKERKMERERESVCVRGREREREREREGERERERRGREGWGGEREEWSEEGRERGERREKKRKRERDVRKLCFGLSWCWICTHARTHAHTHTHNTHAQETSELRLSAKRLMIDPAIMEAQSLLWKQVCLGVPFQCIWIR
jgi:hypothetical protein